MAREPIAPNKPTRARRAGLTLVDVTLTIVIIGLLAAVGAPRFAHVLDGMNLEAGAQRVAADLRRARQQARAKGAPQSVVFSTTNGTYELLAMHGSDRPGAPYLVDLAEPPYSVSLVSASLGAMGTGSTVVFDMYGRPDYGGTVVVAAGGQQRTIRIEGLTGRVSIE